MNAAGWIAETFIPVTFILFLVLFCPNFVALQTSWTTGPKMPFISPVILTVEIFT